MNKFIFGKNSVLDAIKNNFPIKKLYLSKNIKLQNTNLPSYIVTICNLIN